MKVHARIFTIGEDKFLVPGYWYAPEDPEVGLGDIIACMTEAMLIAVVIGARSHGWLEVETNSDGIGQVPNVEYRLASPRFAHGALDVLLIAGPRYDAAIRENLST